jgi:hypothetical protein
MGILGKKLRGLDGGRVAFACPGCDEMHQVAVREDGNRQGPIWGYNGNPDAPTFTPSVLVKSGHYCSGQSGKDCWCTYEERFGEKPPAKCFVCHSFVRDGRIQFLGDCTHALAGQTVELPDIAEES